MSLSKRAKETVEIPPQHLAKEPKLGFVFLLICLIALLLIPAYFDRPLMGGLATNITLSVTLLAGLYLVAYQLKELLIGVLLAIPVLLASWGDSLLPTPWNVYLANSFYVIFLCYICVTSVY